jgi:Fe-S-cluster containining protein
MAQSLSHQIRSYRPLFRKHRSSLRRFLTRLSKNKPRGLDARIRSLEPEVWKKVDCLSCANCCKTMTPTYTPADQRRIAGYLGMTVGAFQKKYLQRERGGDRDWMNKSTPCPFLNRSDNKCRIYSVRPADCAGFPHLGKRFEVYGHVHHQNVDLCPATFELVSRLKNALSING